MAAISRRLSAISAGEISESACASADLESADLEAERTTVVGSLSWAESCEGIVIRNKAAIKKINFAT